jgi:TP901 family phage tail tape measure protein
MIIRAKDQATRIVNALQGNVAGGFNRIARETALANRELTLHAQTIRGKYGTQLLQQQKVLNGAIMQGDAMRARGARQTIRNLKIMQQGELQELDAMKRRVEFMSLANARAKEQAIASAEARRHALRLAGAFTVIGIAAAAATAAGVYGLYKLATATNDYNHQAAITLTQTTGLKTSVKELRKISDGVAASIGVPLETLQPMLYDIFSSMNVNVKQSAVLLRNFAKEAVAGNVSIQDAGRSTIGIMNAFRLPISSVTKVLDFQFRLVEKGVGTFGQFANVIGRAVPSAVRAGQSFQTLGGMLAFLTRNGLSAAMAAASAGRALDALSNPKVVGRLKDFGDTISKASGLSAAKLRALGIDIGHTSVQVADAHGKFRPLVDIMRELSAVLIKLPPVQRVAVLQAIFKGAGGTIQARRFFDIAIKNFPQLAQLIAQVGDNAGAMERAYRKASHTVAVRTELIRNRLKLLRNRLSDELQPALVSATDAMVKMTDKGGLITKMAKGLADFLKGTLVPNLIDTQKWFENNGDVIKTVADNFTFILKPSIDDTKKSTDNFNKSNRILVQIVSGVVESILQMQKMYLELALTMLFTRKWILNFGIAMVSVARWTLGIFDPNIRKATDNAIKYLRAMRDDGDRQLREVQSQLHKTNVAIFDLEHGVSHGKNAISKDMKTVANVTRGNMERMRGSINSTSRTIANFHGKRVDFTATGHVRWDKNADLLRKLTGNFTHKLPAQPFAGGGPVEKGSGPRADDVLALLSRGEFVLNAKAAKSIGLQTLQRLNAMQLASGGFVNIGRPMGGLQRTTRSADFNMTRTMTRNMSQLHGHDAMSLLMAMGLAGMGVPGFPSGASPKGAIQKLAMAMLAARGWGAQWPSFNALEMGEAGWNVYARNPSSGAFGLPQALPPGKLPRAAFSNDPMTAAFAQLTWMMSYIASVYRNPNNAYATWLSRSPHWYHQGGPVRSMDRGGYLVPGLNTVWNGTGRPEPVGGGGTVQLIVQGNVYGSKAGIDQLVNDIISGLAANARRGGPAKYVIDPKAWRGAA